MACTLTLTILRISPPTVAGGWGELAFRIGGAVDLQQLVDVRRASDGLFVQGMQASGNADYSFPIPPYGVGVDLVFTVFEEVVYDSTTCQATETVVVPSFAATVDPSLTEPPRWQPVGGVLPNPVPLDIEAVLLDAAGAPRAGLHAELELWRPGALAAFASFRATVRTASQTVDAAPYLRAQLVALPRYNALATRPLIDPDTSLRFSYRFRLADSLGPEAWLERAGERYAVLAALPGPADTMADYVADGTGRVASVFASGEAVQFVGLPLEASVLLPPAAGAPRWAELRYIDAGGGAVEIRTYPLADTLPAGMLRIPLPNDPPLCATALEVSVRDDNRAFVGTCGYVVPPAPISTRGTYADPIIGFY